jgi:hypothetical protein
VVVSLDHRIALPVRNALVTMTVQGQRTRACLTCSSPSTHTPPPGQDGCAPVPKTGALMRRRSDGTGGTHVMR